METNLQDFGKGFAESKGRTKGLVPTVYGPITIVLQPAVLKPASDVAVCLRSAWAPGFNRSKESLQDIADVERLFRSADGPEVKYRIQLKQEFGLDDINNPEVSCMYDWGYAIWRFAKKIVVDPYEFQGETLLKWVEEVPNRPASVPLEERCDDPIYKELGNELTLYPHTAASLASSKRVGEEMKGWAASVVDSEWSYQFDRFSKYLWDGTISTILDKCRG